MSPVRPTVGAGTEPQQFQHRPDEQPEKKKERPMYMFERGGDIVGEISPGSEREPRATDPPSDGTGGRWSE